ncbi:hypothetical protein DsansV1_C07g0077531 [Dioscorea sansibarensis]
MISCPNLIYCSSPCGPINYIADASIAFFFLSPSCDLFIVCSSQVLLIFF